MGHGLKSRGQLIETMSGEDRVARSQKECESKGGGGAIGPMVRGGKDSWGEGVGEISGGDGGGGGEGGGGGGGGNAASRGEERHAASNVGGGASFAASNDEEGAENNARGERTRAWEDLMQITGLSAMGSN